MKNRLSILLAILMVTTSAYAQRDEDAGQSHGTLSINGPDLVVSDISLSPMVAPLQLHTNGSISIPIEVTILNKGNEVARSPFGVHIRLEIAGEQIEVETIPKLSANESYTFTKTAQLPVLPKSRQINFSSSIDPPGGRVSQTGPRGGFIKETNEENNIFQVYLQLPEFDSAVVSNF